MHVTVSISSNILLGAATGAWIALIVVLVVAFVGSFFDGAISMGSGHFGRKFLSGAVRVVPAFALVGAILAATGLPWWAAGLALILALAAANALAGVRRARRGY